MLTLKNRSIAGTAAVIATLMTVAAAAPVRAETVRIPVSYGDLDLSTKAGVASLDRRIARAADEICGAATPGNRLDVATCRRTVIASAQVDARAARANTAPVVLAAK